MTATTVCLNPRSPPDLGAYIYSENTLYFGCRSASKDQHYATEWHALADSNALTYRTAFSRDVPEGAPRRYVQDVMHEDARTLWRLLGVERGWLYISGCVDCVITWAWV